MSAGHTPVQLLPNSVAALERNITTSAELEDKIRAEVAAAPTSLGHLAHRSAISSTRNRRDARSGANLFNAATISIGEEEMAGLQLAT
jgi:hypothetical protein